MRAPPELSESDVEQRTATAVALSPFGAASDALASELAEQAADELFEELAAGEAQQREQQQGGGDAEEGQSID